jgi:hypothetical protein
MPLRLWSGSSPRRRCSASTATRSAAQRRRAQQAEALARLFSNQHHAGRGRGLGWGSGQGGDRCSEGGKRTGPPRSAHHRCSRHHEGPAASRISPAAAGHRRAWRRMGQSSAATPGHREGAEPPMLDARRDDVESENARVLSAATTIRRQASKPRAPARHPPGRALATTDLQRRDWAGRCAGGDLLSLNCQLPGPAPLSLQGQRAALSPTRTVAPLPRFYWDFGSGFGSMSSRRSERGSKNRCDE